MARTALLKPSLNWLLAMVPGVVLLDLLAPERHTLIFVCACIAVIPLAGWLGKATEHLAERTLERAQLLVVYLILGIVFYFLPAA